MIATEVGHQRPRVLSLPTSVSSTGREAVDLAALAGLHLDPWQAFVLENALGERANGHWAAFEVGLVVSRQNGKGSILEARELAGLFLLGERLIVHSAHQFDTSLEAFRRLLALIEDTPDFDQRVKRVVRSHGEEGIELKGGQRIRFRTRTKGGGRGFTCDCLILDEAMILPESAHGALLPTLSARPNPQVWYTGSAVDQAVHEHGVVLARVRERGIKGDDPNLAYFEWSLDAKTPLEFSDATAEDDLLWAAANPGFGIRISPEHIANEWRSMDARTFAVERLGVGDWPDTTGLETVIDIHRWRSLVDAESRIVSELAFAFDISPDRSVASIAAAGKRADRLAHVEVFDRHPGTGWLPERLRELKAKHKPSAIVCDAAGPAASLLHDLDDLGIVAVSAKEHANACGMLVDLVDQERLRHLGSSELLSALKGATRRPLGDAWAWSRKNSATDISPLVASTLALWGSETQRPQEVFAFSW